MHVSKEVDFAIRLIMILSTGSANAKDLAEKYQIPHNFVQLVIPKLCRAGMVAAVSGQKNVYELVKDVSELTLLDVVTVINGPIDLLGRHYAKTHATDQKFQPMIQVFHELQEKINSSLGAVSIQSLLN